MNKNKLSAKKLWLLVLCLAVLVPCFALSGCIHTGPYVTNKKIVSSDFKHATVEMKLSNPTNKTMVCTITATVHWKFGGGMHGMTATATNSTTYTIPPKTKNMSVTVNVSHTTDKTSKETTLRKVKIESQKQA